MTESASKEFVQSKNALLHHGLTLGGWTRWPTEVPSNPYYSVILWFCDSYRFNWAALLPFVWASPAFRQSQRAAIRWYGFLVCCDHSLLHCTPCTPTSLGVLRTLVNACQLYTYPAHIQSTTDLVSSHTWAGLNPCCLAQESIHKEVLNAPPTPFSVGTVICLSWDTQCYVIFDFQMNNDNEEDKKKKIHLIFSVNKTHFVFLPPSSFLLWAFTDSRICYRVLIGNSSSLFTVSAGGIIATRSLNSWFSFSVCFSFSISNLPSWLPFLLGKHLDIQTGFETNLIAYP